MKKRISRVNPSTDDSISFLKSKAQFLEQSLVHIPHDNNSETDVEALVSELSVGLKHDPVADEDYLYYLTLAVQTKNDKKYYEKLYSYIYEQMNKDLPDISFHMEDSEFVDMLYILTDDILGDDRIYEPFLIPYQVAAFINQKKEAENTGAKKKSRKSVYISCTFSSDDLMFFFNDRTSELADSCVIRGCHSYVISELKQIFTDVYLNKNKSTSVLLGVPPNVAYRIGMAYLNGSELQMDKKCAKEWFFYGLVCGDPRCTLAYILYFANVSLFDEISCQNSTAFVYFLLVNSYLICSHSDLSTYRDYLCLSSSQISFFEVQTLSNLLSFISTVCLDIKQEGLSIKQVPEFVPQIFDEIQNILQRYPQSTALKACVVSFMQIACDLSLEPVVYEDMLMAMKAKLTGRTAAECFEKALDAGMKEHCRESYRAYVRLYHEYKGGYGFIPMKHLKNLAELGEAEATFFLGNANLQKNGEEYSIKLWEKATKQGHGFSAFNCSLGALLAEEHEKSIRFANIALSRGIVFGYYMLYLNYKDSNRPLAHTYLRLASEYLFPDAVSELRALRAENLYHPLPFMQALEDLENMSFENPHAALILSQIYISSSLLPFNHEKSLYYQKKAVSGGLYSVYPLYMKMYQTTYSNFDYKNSFFTSYRNSLDRTESFFHSYHDEMVPPDSLRKATEKVKEIVDCLKKGKTELEKDMLYEASRSDLVAEIAFSEKDMKNILEHKPVYEEVINLGEALSRGEHNVPREQRHESFEDFVRMLLKRYSFLERNQIPDSEFGDLCKALIAVRSAFGKVNFSMYSHYLRLAVNSNNRTALLLDSIDFSSVCPQDVSFEDPKESEDIEQDVFISAVTQ